MLPTCIYIIYISIYTIRHYFFFPLYKLDALVSVSLSLSAIHNSNWHCPIDPSHQRYRDVLRLFFLFIFFFFYDDTSWPMPCSINTPTSGRTNLLYKSSCCLLARNSHKSTCKFTTVYHENIYLKFFFFLHSIRTLANNTYFTQFYVHPLSDEMIKSNIYFVFSLRNIYKCQWI